METRGRDANGGRDLLPLDCGPGVHLSHISQVPGAKADSVLRNKDLPLMALFSSMQLPGTEASRFGCVGLLQTGSRETVVGQLAD